RRDLQRLGRGQALELLPVTGLLEDALDGLARLRADREPVLHPLGVDLDARGLLLRVVDPELLDRSAVALGPRVGDDDAVLRVADLAHPHEPDLYGHVYSLLCVFRRNGTRLRVTMSARSARWGSCGRCSWDRHAPG